MERVRLRDSGIEASRLAFGCWGLVGDFHWGTREERESVAAIHAALDAGVSLFDTAAMYAEGASERLLGRALGDRRGRVLIATKLGLEAMHPDRVAAACDAALGRLGTDHVDLLQTHWFTDRDIPPEDTWAAMLRLVEQGKVRAIGVCNTGPGDLSRLEPAPLTNQVPYSLLWRAIEGQVLPASRAREVGILAYSPLVHGLLAGRFRSADDVPTSRARSRHFSSSREMARHGEPGQEALTFETVRRLEAIAGDVGRPLSDVALAWVLAQPGVSCVIAGARDAAQATRNAEACALQLSADVLARLDEATQDLKHALGPNPDMWQGDAGSRYH